VANIVNGKLIALAIKFVPKKAQDKQLSSSLKELPYEEPKMADVSISLEESIE
jgi:hypothetical protein